jgi:hypothetical protein
MKKITIPIICLMLIACGNAKDQKTNDSSKSDSAKVEITNKITTGDWDYVNIKKTVLEVFPEAYPEFFEVTFSDWGDKAYPETASFCVPDKYFPKPLTEEVLDNRAKLINEKFQVLGPGGINVSEPIMYSYVEWADKKIRRVTFYFLIGG